MTFKKSNKQAQAIFEYFILTIVIATIVLFFTASPHFQKIKNDCEAAFDGGIEEMLNQPPE